MAAKRASASISPDFSPVVVLTKKYLKKTFGLPADTVPYLASYFANGVQLEGESRSGEGDGCCRRGINAGECRRVLHNAASTIENPVVEPHKPKGISLNFFVS